MNSITSFLRLHLPCFFIACSLCFPSPASAQYLETILHSFTGAPSDGAVPNYPNLVQGTDGNFYGTTLQGGNANNGNTGGTIFKITPDGMETILHNFGGVGDGYQPNGLFLGTDGFFYGTTQLGGSYASGCVFKFVPSTNTYSILHNFGDPSVTGGDGGGPLACVIQGADGNFYGTTQAGPGRNGIGTIFKMTPDGTVTNLHYFAPGDGGPTLGPLIEDAHGYLYGTGNDGGANDEGTIFEITTAGGAFEVIHTFTGTPGDGSNPTSGLVSGPDGLLYGTTHGGGTNGVGVVYKIGGASSNQNYTILYNFSDALDGANPNASLLLGLDGNFYGTATNGGSTTSGGTNGAIFKITPSGNLTVLYNFLRNNIDGFQPMSGLTLGADGSFYGTTNNGGTSGLGTVFKLSLQQAPIFFGPLSAYYVAGQTGILDFVYLGSPAPAISVSNLPPFISYNSTTGVITISSSAPTGGPYKVTFTGANGISPDATATISFYVLPSSQPPAITNGPPTSIAILGTFYQFIFTTTAAPPGTFSITSGLLPPGIVLTSGGILYGTPSQAGTYTFTVTQQNGAGPAFSQTYMITVLSNASSADTPSMPTWALVVMTVLLGFLALRRKEEKN